MPIKLKMRKVDLLLRSKAIVYLKNGETLTGFGDCIVWLPINDETDEDDEFLRFILKDGGEEYIREEDIEKYEIL